MYKSPWRACSRPVDSRWDVPKTSAPMKARMRSEGRTHFAPCKAYFSRISIRVFRLNPGHRQHKGTNGTKEANTSEN